MKSYLFVLGRTTSLCEAELKKVLGTTVSTLTEVTDTVIFVEAYLPLHADTLIDTLGGTIKIAEVVGFANDLMPQNLTPHIVSWEASLTFGVSVYGNRKFDMPYLLGEMKACLKTSYPHIRFVLPQEGTALSSVVVKKQHVLELITVFDPVKKQWIIGKTLVTQDVDVWSQRDFGRPFADTKAGMLPPKVARMMVNLASSQLTDDSRQQSKTLLDPFCGMGTVLSEGLMLGWDVIGGDQSAEAVVGAKANIEWLVSTYPVTQDKKYELFVADATHISEKIDSYEVDAIISEPFMGAVFETHSGHVTQKQKKVTQTLIYNTLKGLEKLYIGAFRDWMQVLKSGGRVVIAFPEIRFGNHVYSVKKVFDSCEKLGYTLTLGPFRYSRPRAVVSRQIYVFTKA